MLKVITDISWADQKIIPHIQQNKNQFMKGLQNNSEIIHMNMAIWLVFYFLFIYNTHIHT